MTGSGGGDYWTDLSGPGPGGDGGAAPAPALHVEAIEGVEPLGDQFGVAEPLSVPPGLRAALFGQPEVIAGRAALPLYTYAVLDAAKVHGLPEMLETSGLDHACLFQGAAAEDYRDVAPWLVRLEESHRLTRGLFTQSDAPWDMWDREPGIFLRSAASLDALRKHLRKFTKVRDEDGKWYYARFWEPRWCAWSIQALDETQGGTRFLRPVARVVALDPRLSQATVIGPVRQDEVVA
ncbi:DUF4123 domain-containing protein [Rhodovulum sulfidophilum]|uniref:DUF4123 domain-containing protein n=1 Tax=Rhodovulum sulfidophilum TaxID=35806 RepID=UPI0019235E71|nr:DUF4123 domain-containing protein [Rhodovulum sulfidophilum]MBL3597810.1 DUF4123 domain-containing protein [Rhodovulum sulfidophilum]